MSKPFSVLLVDDDPDTQAVFQDVLDHHAIELISASSKVTALAALAECRPDVIVLDIFLPDTDGYKLLKVIRGLPNPVQCPIVATTAYYTSDLMAQLQERGFDGCLLKPFDPETLAASLEEWANLQR